jgi:hypothetical protein
LGEQQLYFKHSLTWFGPENSEQITLVKVQNPADKCIQDMSKCGYLEMQRKAKARWVQAIILVVVVAVVVAAATVAVAAAIFSFEWHPHDQRNCFSQYCFQLASEVPGSNRGLGKF